MRAQLAAIALCLVLVPLSASARFHLWQITEIYSNADGSVQFVELFNNADLEDLLAGHNLTSTANTYMLPHNLSTTSTTNHFLLIATAAFQQQPGCTNVAPDFTTPDPFLPANFMSTAGPDTINFAAVNTFSYVAGELPTAGVHPLNEPFNSTTRTTAVNSPTNFAGNTCSLPEPSSWLGQLAGAAGVLALARRRRSATRTTRVRGSG